MAEGQEAALKTSRQNESNDMGGGAKHTQNKTITTTKKKTLL